MKKSSLFAGLLIGLTVLLPGAKSAFGQCTNPDPFLGNDTTICQGQALTLNPGNPGSYNTYLWDNNATSASRVVAQAGTYWVQVGTISSNLIVNGDFESGNTGFTTDYVLGTGGSWGQLSSEGTYAISTSPNLVHTNFSNCQDHTPNPGTQMMIVNGSGSPNTDVWCQTVAVDPGTDYQFSTWASSALNDNNVAQLQFSINGSVLGSIFSPSNQGCTWNQFYQVWNSGIQTSAQICIVNQNIGVSGNDFMIDDISFAPICYERDTIVVSTIAQPVITATPNDTICVGELSNIVASSTNPNLTYTWNPGAIASPTLNVSPAVTTVYNVTATTPEGCVSNLISRFVVVRPAPTVDIQASADTICTGGSVTMVGFSSDLNVQYTWNPNLSTTSTLIDSPTNGSDYSVIVTNQYGCEGYDTIRIEVIPPLTASIAGDFTICDGETTVLTASGNYAQMQFTWSDGTVGNQLVASPNQTQTYSVSGDYYNCPAAAATVTVNVNAIPTISLSEDVQICSGEVVTAAANSSVSNSVIHWLPMNTTGATQSFTIEDDMYVYAYADNAGCLSAIDSFFVDVSFGCDVQVPNVFTPNADGSNDFFTLVSYEGIEQLNCVILNRWGNVLREFNTPNFAWDGKDKSGLDVVEGVYFYKITGNTTSKDAIEKQGFVELVR